jgi:UDP-glucose 4-epimerase
MEMKCLVIGGCGFIGSSLIPKLIESGRTITVIDNKEPLNNNKVGGVTYVSGDFSDFEFIDQLVSKHNEVIHLAYATHPNTSFNDPLADLAQNLSPAVQLFEVAARCGVRLMFVSSGGTVYGEAQTIPIDEDHPTLPISPYGVTKLTLEKYAYLYAETRGLNVVCVRPANPYGEGQYPFIGQGFIPTAIATAMQDKPITIYGEKGTIRDYIYIDDLVEGMLTVLEHGVFNEIYNIGSSTGRSNLEVVQVMDPMLDNIGIKLSIDYQPSRPFDVKVNVLDCSKLLNLGWRPICDFENGLEKTVKWLMK